VNTSRHLYTSDRIGMFFDSNETDECGSDVITLPPVGTVDHGPQVQTASGRFIPASDGWVKVSGVFYNRQLAKWDWLTIGTFSERNATILYDQEGNVIPEGEENEGLSYFMVDDVTVRSFCNRDCYATHGEPGISHINTEHTDNTPFFIDIENANYALLRITTYGAVQNTVDYEFTSPNGNIGRIAWDGRMSTGAYSAFTGLNGARYDLILKNCDEERVEAGTFSIISHPTQDYFDQNWAYDYNRQNYTWMPNSCCLNDWVIEDEYFYGKDLLGAVNGNITIGQNVRLARESDLELRAQGVIINPNNVVYDGTVSTLFVNPQESCSNKRGFPSSSNIQSEVMPTPSLAESTDFDFAVFPNPCADALFLYSSNSIASYQVVSIAGNVVLSGALPNSNIDVSSLSAGLYVVRVVMHDGNVVTRKIAKL